MKSIHSNRRRSGFTLVEVLAAVTIIGILVFLAIPSITAVRRDTEENMAVAKANMLNMAVSSYISAVGPSKANEEWTATPASGVTPEQMRYNKFSPYLSYPTATLSAYMPSGYTVALPSSLTALEKVRIYKPLKTGQTTAEELQY
jgi:prepilin-type N-terminal cleavage/methylation domain-containing protein